MSNFTIKDVRVFLVESEGDGGDYFQKGKGHWLIDTLIANPMSGYPKYRETRSCWGIGVMGSIVVEIETEDGHRPASPPGSAALPAAWMIKHHFSRFLWARTRATPPGSGTSCSAPRCPMAARACRSRRLALIDLALWDLIGKVAARARLQSDRRADAATRSASTARRPLPTPSNRSASGAPRCRCRTAISTAKTGSCKNVAYLTAQREKVGPDYPLMVDCYMSLTVPYAIRLAEAAKHLDIFWWEEVLHPDDIEGFRDAQAGAPDSSNGPPASTNTPATASGA